MISVIAYYLTTWLILNLFLKVDKSKIFCGIFAFSGYKNLTPAQERIVMYKMKILGLFNQSRGQHGCGIYFNGEVIKGFDNLITKKDTKLFHNFISNEDYVMPQFDSRTNSCIIGHTRQATSGAHVEANTHPFFIQSEDARNNLVGVHNGQIENVWDMCNQHGIKHTDYHVDSKALYMLMDKIGVEEILTKYKGYAALVWAKPSEPNSLNVFHGAARKIRNEEPYEERPLYYMKSEEGIYISSLENSLIAIRDSADQKIHDVEYNHVLKITNGKFTSSKKRIYREDANLYVPYVHKQQEHVYPVRQPQIGFPQNDRVRNEVNTVLGKGTIETSGPTTSKIWKETVPVRADVENGKIRVMFHKGRYWVGVLLAQGQFYLNHKGIVDDKEKHETRLYYFWAGVMLKDEASYTQLVKFQEDKNSFLNNRSSNFAYSISKFSAHPVTNLESDFVEGKESKLGYWRFAFYEDTHRVKSNFSVKFSSRTYVIKNAFLEGITSAEKTDVKFFEEEEDHTVPFLVDKNGQCCGVKDRYGITKRGSSKDSVFDAIFETVQEAIGTITGIEKRALLLYCEEALKTMSPLDPTEPEIDAYFCEAIRRAVLETEPLRTILEDSTYTLEMYVEILEEDEQKTAPLLNATKTEIENWQESFYNRNGYYAKLTKGEASVTSETNFHKDDSHTSHHCEFVEEPELKDDENLHDNAFSENEINIDMALEKIDTVVDQLAMLEETAEELKANNSDLAQEIASILMISLDDVSHKLRESLIKNERPEMASMLSKKVKVSI